MNDLDKLYSQFQLRTSATAARADKDTVERRWTPRFPAPLFRGAPCTTIRLSRRCPASPGGAWLLSLKLDVLAGDPAPRTGTGVHDHAPLIPAPPAWELRLRITITMTITQLLPIFCQNLAKYLTGFFPPVARPIIDRPDPRCHDENSQAQPRECGAAPGQSIVFDVARPGQGRGEDHRSYRSSTATWCRRSN